MIRETYLEERSKEAAQLGNLQEERKLHNIITTEKSKDRARRLQFLRPIKKGSGGSRLTIETNTESDEGTLELRDIEQNVELETISMREIKQRSRISEKHLAMKSPLVNHLHFNGMAEYGNNILLGQTADTPHLDIHTKRYLQELAAITLSLPDQPQPIPMEEYTKEVGRTREET